MSVAPKLQELLERITEVKPKLAAIGFKRTQANVREAFATAQRKYMTDIDYMIFALDDIVCNEGYPVPIRIYIPRLDIDLPLAIFIHGGGHTAGSLSQYDGVARKLAKQTGHIIVSIDYRLSPEFTYPTGLNDCKAAISGVYAVLDERRVKYKDNGLALIGDSAGGALCASITQDRKLLQSTPITRQVLIYPSLDYTLSSQSIEKYAVGYYLEKSTIEWYFSNYCPITVDRRTISPVYGEFHSAMPATLIVSAGYDPLQDEAKHYYDNMIKAGASAELLHIDNVIHAYLSLEDLCKDECARTYQEINNFLNKLV